MHIGLCVMAKLPKPGFVNTRLTPAWTPEEAAELQAALLTDVLSRQYPAVAAKYLYIAASTVEGEGAAASVPPAALVAATHPEIAELAEAYGWQIRDQQGEGLGERMQIAAEEVLNDHSACLVLGTDAPGLPLDELCAPLGDAEHDRGVLVTPSSDGGYVAMRTTRAGLVLFSPELSWGTSRVMSQTLALAAEERVAITVLDPWFDLDTVADIERELVKCTDERRTRLEASAPQTMKFVRQMFDESSGNNSD
jgi:glycosyltransferase A (GT-A) superfamily protein (DUF2064 family)